MDIVIFILSVALALVAGFLVGIIFGYDMGVHAAWKEIYKVTIRKDAKHEL